MNSDTLLLVHLLLTSFLCGLIWVVQVVHYPLFDRVERSQWAEFSAAHRRRIGVVVVPTMVGEAVTAVLLWVVAGSPLPAWLAALNLAALAAIWLSTALLQVPAHRLLERRFDAQAHRRLVLGNGLRTGLWTARLVGLSVAAVAQGRAV